MSIIVATRIIPSCDGTYRSDPEGEWAAVTRVHDRHGELVDLVAWYLNEPGNWWLRRGDETPILGSRNLAMAAYYGDAITLHQNPQDWLLAARRGACVIKWSWPLAELFDGVGMVDCDSPELQHRFLAVLRRWEPCVTVRQWVSHAT
jgi:hypothetical protein